MALLNFTPNAMQQRLSPNGVPLAANGVEMTPTQYQQQRALQMDP